MDNNSKVHCDSCNKTYNSHRSLLRHNDQIHSENPTFQCSQCSKRFGGKSELEKHMQTHDTANFFKATCSFCGKKAKTSESLDKHVKRFHIKEFVHQCSECPKTFRYPNELKKHKQSRHETKHLDDYFQCGECAKRLKTRDSLDLHKRMHSGEKPYSCHFCEKKFRQSTHRLAHERRVHEAPGGKTFTCNECPKTFDDPRHKRIHEIAHFKEQIKCNVCEKYVKHLGDHIKRVHTVKPIKNIGCRSCKAMFDSTGKRNKHEKMHREEERDKQCPYCSYRTIQSSNLKTHIKTHNDTREKPFECIECDYKSANKTDLSRHIDSRHREVEMLTCQLCFKDVKPYNYKKHMLGHSETKMKCDTCNKEFTNSNSLQKHKKSHFGMAKGTPQRKVKPTKVINCPICEKPLKGLQSLENHRIRAHTLEKPHACGVCGKLFHIEKEKKYHEQIHKGVKSYSCSECDKTYTQRRSLQYHKKSVHKQVTYDCHQCEKKFKFPGSLKAHMNLHSDNQRTMYSCDICGAEFTTKIYIKTHKEAQHEQIKHECPTCGFKLKYKNQLKLHLETHNENGNKKFECNLCGEKFSTTAYMKLHKKAVHLRMKHACPHCTMVFQWRITLAKHVKESHNSKLV